MKKMFVFLSLFLIFFFFSCSNNNQEIVSDSVKNEEDLYGKTLKEILSAKNEDTIWTKEIEPDILSYSLRNEDFLIGSNIELTSEILSLFSNKKNPLYPDLDTFGNLDISRLNTTVVTKINSFITSVSENPYSEQSDYFDSKYLFNYIFFLNDIKNSWKENTGKDFPLKENFENLLKDPDDVNSGSKDSSTKKQIQKISLFSKWIYGEPFISDTVIQLPVRLYIADTSISNNSYININLFLKNDESLKIYNLSINSWGGK